MVVDTSALVAILRDEPEQERFLELLAESEDPVISAATLLECSLVMHGKRGNPAIARLDDLLRTAGTRCVAVDEAQALVAREAWLRYGKSRSPARLNYGQCFSYALAKTQDRPLLFKGDDFAQTDVRSAG